MSKLKLLYEAFFSPKHIKALISYNEKGYLHEIGWFNAFDTQTPMDADRNPIPWVTYGFIDFIKERLDKQQTIFEFGSGSSTNFYAKHAGVVVSVEHDKAWFDKVLAAKPENAEIIFCELVYDGDYCRVPQKLEEKFDIIIVDGRDRVNCCKQSVDALSESGVVVLDDSERKQYAEGIEFLKHNGFKQISFSGISPGLFYNKATSIFYRSNNCLSI